MVLQAYRVACRDADPSDPTLRARIDDAFEELRRYYELRSEATSGAAGPASEAALQIAHDVPVVVVQLKVLGLAAGASLKQVRFAFKRIEEKYRESDPEWPRARYEQAQRAHSAVKTIYGQRLQLAREGGRTTSSRVRVAMWLVFAVLSITAANMHLPEIRAAIMNVSEGDLLYLKRDDSFFGTVVGYDPEHVFSLMPGEPVPAFKVRLGGTDSEIWMSKWFILRAASKQAADEAK